MTLYKFSQFANTPNKLNRPQRGEVVENKDPKKLGRVKVKIPGLLESEVSLLPWIYPENPYAHGGNQKSAALHVPRMGSTLKVIFPYGLIYHGFYASYWHHDNNYAMEKFKKNYPNRFGSQDPTGNYIVHDKTDHTVEYGHVAQDDDQSTDSVDTGDENTNDSGSSSFKASNLKDGSAPSSSSSQDKIYFKIDKEGTLLINSLKHLTTTFNGDRTHQTGGDNKHTIGGQHIVEAAQKMLLSSDKTALLQGVQTALVKGSKIFLN